jgi:hypothetical protein
MAGDNGSRLKRLHLLEHLDPALAQDIRIREDREEPVLHKVTGEEDALVRRVDDLVASRVSRQFPGNTPAPAKVQDPLAL